MHNNDFIKHLLDYFIFKIVTLLLRCGIICTLADNNTVQYLELKFLQVYT